jgi:hypothetical protein
MPSVQKEIELAVCVDKQPGVLNSILDTLASQAIRIVAYCFFYEQGGARVLLVAQNPREARLVLEATGYKCAEGSVVVVGEVDDAFVACRAGSFMEKQGIKILHSYTCLSTNWQFAAVFKTADDEHAHRALKGWAAAYYPTDAGLHTKPELRSG